MMMRNKKYLVIAGTLLIIPVLMAFLPEVPMQQRWWQRKKEPVLQEKITTLTDEKGIELIIEFEKGNRHNHPLMVLWVAATMGNYLQSLYVAESIAKGYFRHGDPTGGRWQPGPLRRPAALPYWGHKRGVQATDGYFIPSVDNPMPDAVSGATPKGDFLLYTKLNENTPDIINILMEINQSWDWNSYWHNNRFPDDENYKTSSQPALVYKARIDLNAPQKEFVLKPAGHSHWSGASGELFPDLNTITTALEIAKRVTVKIKL
jgi:hypothetical protein